MSLPTSLSGALEAAEASMGTQGEQSQDSAATVSADLSSAMGVGGQAIAEQSADSEQGFALPGITPEKPTEAQPGVKPEGEAQGPPLGNLDLTGDPAQVVGTVDGKPVTLSELKSGYMRYADYTQANQQMKGQIEGAKSAMEFVEANQDILGLLGQAGAAADRGDEGSCRDLAFQALSKAAEDYGLQIVRADQASPGGQARDPVSGQFVSRQSAVPTVDLDEIREEFGEESVAYRMALQNDAMAKQLAKVTGALEKITGGVAQTIQGQQVRSELETVAGQYKAKGVENLNLDQAAALVGKPLSPAQALFLANADAIVRHIAQTNAKRPNEPGMATGRGATSLAGKSLSQAIKERMFAIGLRDQ